MSTNEQKLIEAIRAFQDACIEFGEYMSEENGNAMYAAKGELLLATLQQPEPEQASGDPVAAWVIPGAECDDRGWIPAKAWQEDEFTQPLYAKPKPRSPRFATTSCSQCGGDFGPSDAGFSHCEDHAALSTLPAAPVAAKPAFNGWYCAHCQRGVDCSEVTYHEQHTVCGRVITDDEPPVAAKPETQGERAEFIELPPLPEADGYAALTEHGSIIVPPSQYKQHNAYAVFTAEQMRSYARAALLADGKAGGEVVDLVLYCPKCHTQHIDAPEIPANEPFLYTEENGIRRPVLKPARVTPPWTNPPHKSHLCHGCGHIWRPSDTPTNGVERTASGKDADTRPQPAAQVAQPLTAAQAGALWKVGMTPHEYAQAVEAAHGIGKDQA